jgi:hypothetical protein
MNRESELRTGSVDIGVLLQDKSHHDSTVVSSGAGSGERRPPISSGGSISLDDHSSDLVILRLK